MTGRLLQVRARADGSAERVVGGGAAARVCRCGGGEVVQVTSEVAGRYTSSVPVQTKADRSRVVMVKKVMKG